METHNTADVKVAFSSYLTLPEWNWNWVAHQTFDDGKVPLHRNIVKESFEDLLNEIARTSMLCYGWCFGETGYGGRVHWHSILHVGVNLFGQPRRKDIYEFMFKKYGRMSITPYVGNQREMGNIATKTISDGIARYLTKYLVKGSHTQDAWWDFQGNLGGYPAVTSRIMRVIGMTLPDSLKL